MTRFTVTERKQSTVLHTVLSSLYYRSFFLHCLACFYWKRWVILCWQPRSVSFCQLCNWCFYQYNGVSMKNKTKEEAYLEMLKPAETITFKVQNCVDNLSAIKESRGDGFYIRYPNYSNIKFLLQFCFVACNEAIRTWKHKTAKYANQKSVIIITKRA